MQSVPRLWIRGLGGFSFCSLHEKLISFAKFETICSKARSVRSVEISKIASHGEQDEKPVLYADSLEA